jgi:hypothetical protein
MSIAGIRPKALSQLSMLKLDATAAARPGETAGGSANSAFPNRLKNSFGVDEHKRPSFVPSARDILAFDDRSGMAKQGNFIPPYDPRQLDRLWPGETRGIGTFRWNNHDERENLDFVRTLERGQDTRYELRVQTYPSEDNANRAALNHAEEQSVPYTVFDTNRSLHTFRMSYPIFVIQPRNERTSDVPVPSQYDQLGTFYPGHR